MASLSQKAQDLFGGDPEEMDRILALPINRLRLSLKEAFDSKEKFSDSDFAAFVGQLTALNPNIAEQAAVAMIAVQKGAAPSARDIEINTPEKQLLWAAVLARLSKEKKPVTSLELWQQLQENSYLRNESIMVSKVIHQSLQNDDATFAWGAPGSWFYFSPKENHLNLDLFHSMLVGFEHIRAVHLHEIGHSQLTIAYPKRMRDIFDEVSQHINPDHLTQPHLWPKMTKAEQKKLVMLGAEWRMWFEVFNQLEDVCVDQYAIDMKHRINQHFGQSMNHSAMLLRGYAEILSGRDLEKSIEVSTRGAQDKKTVVEKSGHDPEKHAEMLQTPLDSKTIADVQAGTITPEVARKMFNQINRGALLAAYVKNELFTGKPQDWTRFRVHIDDINNLVDVSAIPAAAGKTAFEYLCELSAGDGKSLRTLQPRVSDRVLQRRGMTMADSFRAAVKETTEARCDVMQHIWDVFLKPYADVLLKDIEEQIDEELNKQPQQGQGQQDPDEQGQDGQESQEGQSEQQEGGQQSSPGQQPGSGGAPGTSSGGTPDSSGGGGPADPNSEAPSGDPQKNDNKNGGGGGSDDDKKQDPSQDLKDILGGMSADPAAQRKKDNDKNAKGQDPGNDKDGKGKDDKNKQKVGDLRNQTPAPEGKTDAERQAQENRAKKLPDTKNSMTSPGAGVSRGVDLAQLQKGNWQEYSKRVAELSPAINKLAEKFIRIRNEQRRQITQLGRSHDFMAADGDIMGMLDRDKMMQTKFRQASRANMTPDDFKKFREHTVDTSYSTIEVVCMIDGSGSMPLVDLGGCSAMEAALQASVIVYEAAQKAKIDCYIVIWGGEPQLVAGPKSKPKDVGAKLEGLRHGTGSGTSLAPGVVGMIDALAKYKNPNGVISGSTHILVYSDGDIADSADTAKVLETVSRYGKNMSIDVSVLCSKKAPSKLTSMEEVFQGVIDRTGSRLVGMSRGHDPNKIPLEMADQMLRRVRAYQIKTEDDSIKRARLKQLYHKMSGRK
jgi:hypothetical protein